MKKDGEDILQGTSLGMEKLHKKVVGTDIEGNIANTRKETQSML